MAVPVESQEVLGQERDVVHPLAQRRHVDRHDAQAVVQILAQRTRRHRVLGVAIGGRDEAHVHDRVGRLTAHAPHHAVVNVRFFAATNRDPEDAVAAGALREGVDDIPLLAEHFLGFYWNRHRAGEQPVPQLSKAAIWALRAHSWPGNVRELQNVIEHAVVLLEPGADVQPEDIPFISDHGSDPELGDLEETADRGESYYEARDRLLARFDRRFLTRVVIRAGGNLSKAARLAKVDRTTFYRLMERHGLQRDLLTGGAE